MSNQFLKRLTPEEIDLALNTHYRAEEIRELHRMCVENPNLCWLPTGDKSIWKRYAGKRTRLSIRAMVYYLEYGTTPVFGICNCRNTGCVNPFHQTVYQVEQSKEDVDKQISANYETTEPQAAK